MPLTGGSVAVTSRVKFGDGTRAVRKIHADKPNDMFPDRIDATAKQQTDAEVLSSKLGRALGLSAPAVHRVSDTEAFMEMKPGKVAGVRIHELDPDLDIWEGDDGWEQNVLQPWVNSRDGIVMGLLDTLSWNYDRHAGNWMLDDNNVIQPIDHGMAWARGNEEFPDATEFGHALSALNPFVRHFGTRRDWVDNPLHPDDVAAVRTRLEGLAAGFAALSRDSWYTDAMLRLDKIEQHATGTERLISDE